MYALTTGTSLNRLWLWAGWPILFPQRETALTKTNAIKKKGSGRKKVKKNEGEWTGKVEIRARK